MNKKEREIVFEAIAKKITVEAIILSKVYFLSCFLKTFPRLKLATFLYMFDLWFSQGPNEKMSAGRCVLLMSNHNGPGDFSEFWCSEDCKTLVFCPPNRNTFLFHISLCSLTTDRPFQRGRMELVFVCLCLSCSCLWWHKWCPCGKELDCDPSATSARPLGSNLPLGCFGLCWRPDCEKFSIALLVPGPFKLLLFLISFPFADWSPACCSSPCWEMFPWGDGSSSWTPSPGWGGSDVLQVCRWDGFGFNIDGAPVGRKIKLLSLCVYRMTHWEQTANTTSCPENWFGAEKEFEERAKPPAVTALSHGEESNPWGWDWQLVWALLPCWLEFWRSSAVQNVQDWRHYAGGFFQAEENSEKSKIGINISRVPHFQIYRLCIN